MQRSVSRILTTHVGSVPFLSLDKGIAAGDESRLADDVATVVARQREIGIDVINEGEYAKGGDWLRYMQNRFGGFTEIAAPEGKPLIEQGRDREEFADFYRYASERGTLFYTPGAQIAKKRPVQVCTGPVSYVGAAALKNEIDVTLTVAGTCSDVAKLGCEGASREQSSSSSTAIAGEGNHAKRGGGGAGLNGPTMSQGDEKGDVSDCPSAATKLRVRRPSHRAPRGPPSPLSRGGMGKLGRGSVDDGGRALMLGNRARPC